MILIREEINDAQYIIEEKEGKKIVGTGIV